MTSVQFHTASSKQDAMTPYQLCHHIAACTRADRVLWFSQINERWRPIASSVRSSVSLDSGLAGEWQRILDELATTSDSSSTSSFNQLLDAYRRDNEVSTLLLLPLQSSDAKQTVSYLILETFQSPTIVDSSELRSDWQTIAPEVATSIQRIVDTQDDSLNSPQLGTWRKALPIALVLITAALFVIRVPLRIPVEGTLHPIQQQRVFAPTYGRVVQVDVEQHQSVEAGDVLLRLQSDELDLQSEIIRGNLATAKAELAARRTVRSDRSTRSTSLSPSRSASESSTNELALKERIASLEKQQQFIQRIQASMIIRAESRGTVHRWDEEKSLLGRDVFQGQWLLDVVNVDSGVQARLHLPERHLHYILHAQSQKKPLVSQLQLRSQPDVAWSSEIEQVASVVTVNEAGNPTIAMLAAANISSGDFEQTLLGATVVGDVHAGDSSLAFMLFRPFFESLEELW
ncbi:biotin/lipoyl-binding protein [Rhodopirellula sp. JC740]|uniref:Biotin/lipoyl-binding protein n=1 Tax=Rhodopirellula halodulae TaxID=2894198 RepID=A0ABS8NJE8_9BACT|nr:biotin/lipoyl-binding protein [Rhodopirellula sp. JC740]MCC9643698.1 biotin/lipoyl-binding protein [Rhodopirellula sp. JC740]